MYTVYIIFSKKLNRNYIGLTHEDLQERIHKHNIQQYGDFRFTAKASDWELRFRINCLSMSQARKIELHLKSMKSKVYLENLMKYPEMTEKLLLKFGQSN
jgi:putative endonuclease